MDLWKLISAEEMMKIWHATKEEKLNLSWKDSLQD